MKKLNTLVLLFVAMIANAQTISGTVKSKEGQGAVPFAKIGIEDEKTGTIADESGRFSLDLTYIPRDKTVKVEVGGYDVLKIPVLDFIKQSPQNILLTEKVREIEEVKITPKKFVEKNWGNNFNSQKMFLNFYPKSIIEQRQYYTKDEMRNNFRELAILFKNNKRVKVNKININFGRFKVDKPVKYRFVFYNEKDGKPGELLNFPEIFADIDNSDVANGTYSLDISDQNIWINQDFFLSLQMLSNDFEGEMSICIGFFGKPNYYRRFVDNWEPLALKASTGVNIDVKVEK